MNPETERGEILHSRSAGGIVIGDGGTIAMVRGAGTAAGAQAWLFPKGHVEKGETDEDAARREIAEESGLTDLEYIDDLGSYERQPMGADGKGVPNEMKEIHMYLFAAPTRAIVAPQMTEEIAEAKWVPYREVANIIGNVKDKVWFGTVFDRVREAIQRD